MKVYDYQWSATFGMDAATAAGELVRDGVDTVLMRNQIDPLPTPASIRKRIWRPVQPVSAGHGSRLVGRAARGRIARLPDDGALLRSRAAAIVPGRATGRRQRRLRTRGSTGTWAFARRTRAIWRPRSSACGASPPSWSRTASFSRSRATRGSGRTGFLVTPSPTPIASVSARAAAPGSPKIWGSSSRPAMPRRRRASSSNSTGRHGPPGARSGSSRPSIGSPPRSHRARPDLEIMLNTLAFPASDFDGLDVRREIAAQDLALLRGSVDRFELMTYLQILDRTRCLAEIGRGRRPPRAARPAALSAPSRWLRSTPTAFTPAVAGQERSPPRISIIGAGGARRGGGWAGLLPLDRFPGRRGRGRPQARGVARPYP